jgi:hypothetical protein
MDLRHREKNSACDERSVERRSICFQDLDLQLIDQEELHHWKVRLEANQQSSLSWVE